MATRHSICTALARSSVLQAPRHVSATFNTRRCLSQNATRPVTAPLRDMRFQKRWDSSAEQPWKLWQFNQIQALSNKKDPSTIILDVREPYEYVEGHIPNAVNMPINSAPEGFFLSPEDFEERFGFEKPSTDAEIVVYCKAGIRSKGAAIIAHDAGYKNIKEYRPSFDDWIANNGAIARGKSPSQ